MRSLGWFQLEPAVESPPDRVWRDWLLVAVVAGTTLAEVTLRDDLPWPPLMLGFGMALALAMLSRRASPLAMFTLGFGGFIVLDLAVFMASPYPLTLYAGFSVLALLYALFRWGSGRHAAIGAGIALAEWIVATTTDVTSAADAAGGLVVLLFAATLGASIRYRVIAREQSVDRVKSHEREVLARELHDTVAHHVTAIAIQAQAGKVLAGARDLEGATKALDVIEDKATRTLAEMRSMVGSLRGDNGVPPFSAQRGVSDIRSMATTDGDFGPRIEIVTHGELSDLRPPVGAALHRVAQESITNAQRHARNASYVKVVIDGTGETIQLRVTDDGERGPFAVSPAGYGLVAMAERITILGGLLDAGPLPDHGWQVEATIPRQGGSS